jgi:hypothetical protein
MSDAHHRERIIIEDQLIEEQLIEEQLIGSASE